MESRQAEFGRRVRQALRSLNAKQSDLAKVTARSQGQISQWVGETSETEASWPSVVRVADGLNAIAAERDFDLRWTAAMLWSGDQPQEASPETPPAAPPPAISAALDDLRWRGLDVRRASEEPGEAPMLRPLETVQLRHYGECPCGQPLVLDDGVWELREVPKHRLLHGMNETNTFAITAVGESMTPKIQPGDLLLVRTDVSWDVGDVVVANIGGAVTVKRLVKAPAGGPARYMLAPDNSDDAPILLSADDVRVVGVAKNYVRVGVL